MAERLLIATTGHPGSGKTTARNVLVNEFDFEPYYPGDTIKHYAPHVDLNDRASTARVQRELRDSVGPNFLVDPVLHSTSRLICWDGLRSPYDAIRLQEAESQGLRTVIVAIRSNAVLRHQRVTASFDRVGKDPPELADFIQSALPEYVNPDLYMPSVLAVTGMAKHFIYNEAYTTLDDLRASVRNIAIAEIAAL